MKLPRSDMRPPCNAFASILRDVSRDDSEHEPAQTGHEEGLDRVEPRLRRQPVAEIHAEEDEMQERNGLAHHRNDQAGNETDCRREQNEARLACAHDRAQTVRDFERAFAPAHVNVRVAGWSA
jgi:hypothetical protein